MCQTDMLHTGFAGAPEADLVCAESRQKATTLLLSACKSYKEAMAIAPSELYQRTAMGSFMSTLIVFPSVSLPQFNWEAHFPTLEECRHTFEACDSLKHKLAPPHASYRCSECSSCVVVCCCDGNFVRNAAQLRLCDRTPSTPQSDQLQS